MPRHRKSKSKPTKWRISMLKPSPSSLQTLLRPRFLLPIVLSVFWTSIPRRLGLYEYLQSRKAHLVGSTPAAYRRGQADWGFTVADLYGDGEEFDADYRNRLVGQTAIVTGANSGIGYEISLGLARLGVRVTMACRSPRKCETAAKRIRRDKRVLQRAQTTEGFALVTMTLDTSSLNSVQAFAREYRTRNKTGEHGFVGPLDMLFLNAGIGVDPAGTFRRSEDGIETLFATNVVGHHLLYKLMGPLLNPFLKRTHPARVVLTSSAASFFSPYPYKVATTLEQLHSGFPITNSKEVMGPYAQSKLAQILWAKEATAQADRRPATNPMDGPHAAPDPNRIVYINAAHPGMVDTKIWNKPAPGTRPTRLSLAARIETYFLNGLKSIMWTAEEGALTLLYLGTAVRDLQEHEIRGHYFHPQSQRIPEHPDAKDDDPETKILQEKLWKFLDELVADFVGTKPATPLGSVNAEEEEEEEEIVVL